MKIHLLIIAIVFSVFESAKAIPKTDSEKVPPQLSYDYPVADPYQSSFLSTASLLLINQEFRWDLEEVIVENRFPERESLAFIGDRIEAKALLSIHEDQNKPLVIVMGGLGANAGSGISLFYQQLLHQSGYHTLGISSPFFWKMNLSQFESATPGNLLKDQYVLYQYIQEVLKKVKSEHNLQFSKIHLTGYSMGGLQSIFLADLDEREQKVRFDKILAINPPVGLFAASKKLDEVLPYWIDRAPVYKDRLMSKIYRLLHSIKENIHEKGVDSKELEEILKRVPFTLEEVKSLIAYSFNETLGNTIFASELVRKRGIINIDENHYSPQPWLQLAKRENFESYFENFLFSDMKKDFPDRSMEELIYLNSLFSKEEFLKRSSRVAIFHNQNDIILSKKEIKFLKSSLPTNRLKIYPLGGHLGNVWYSQNVKDFLLYFVDRKAGE